MDTGYEKIEDDEILAQVRRQARKVNMQSIVYGALLTALFVAIPLLFGV